jgi:membrane protein
MTMTGPSPASAQRRLRRVAGRTLSKSWDDSIFAESAQAGFWSVLSLPPLLLGMLGSLAYIAPFFGPDTLPAIQRQLIGTAGSFFSPNIVTEIIEPTVRDIVTGARGEVVSVGFVISLWAGSSAISAFVDSVVEAHDQTPLRHPVSQRFFALGIYLAALVSLVVAAPILALGPRAMREYIPDEWETVLQLGYYPLLLAAMVTAVTLLYRVALPEPLPTHRLIWGAVLAVAVFAVTAAGLRVYLQYITRTGYTYGALATPIAFLLFAFFLGFAIMLGAEFNAAVEEEWPGPETRMQRWRNARAAARTRRATPADAPAAAERREHPAGISPS